MAIKRLDNFHVYDAIRLGCVACGTRLISLSNGTYCDNNLCARYGLTTLLAESEDLEPVRP